MAPRPLTDIAIRTLVQPRHGQREVWDQRVPGFGIRISHGGARSFVLVYRFRGRPRRLTLGRYPSLTLAEARGLAREAQRAIALGTDPAAEKIRANRVPDLEKFGPFLDHFMQTYAKPKNRTSQETERLLRREFLGRWGNRPIAEISRHDVISVIDKIMATGSPITANSALAAVRRLFNWAVERDILPTSPCAGVRAPAKAVSRDRVLSDDELAIVWNGLETMGYPYGCFGQLLILTAQRKGEVAGLIWSEINPREQVWSIPAARNKARRAHDVPLTDMALRILEKLPKSSQHEIFPRDGSARTLHDFSRWKRELDSLTGIGGWRIHDLRRTAASGMARLAVPPHVVERILNHSSGTLGGVAGVYNRFGYLPEMRAALQQWTSHIAKIAQT